MSSRESDTATTVAAIAGIALIISVACLCGIDDTLVKLGIAAIAALAGIGFAGIMRRP
jgi:hypothetical protein